MSASLARRTESELRADTARVVARLFLPGEEPTVAHSRAGAVVARVLALDEAEVEATAEALLDEFASRYRDFPALLARHASIVGSHLDRPLELSTARTVLLGATFTAAYSVEGAALCNPSAVLHPDQDGLQAAQARVAVSVRGIGEGHVSSIGFATAVIGPGAAWHFEPRPLPAVAGVATTARWRTTHLGAVLADRASIDEVTGTVLRTLPPDFDAADFERVLGRVHPDLLGRPSATTAVDHLRTAVSSAYEVSFPAGVALAQRVLMPANPEERNGIEDARFVRFVDADGKTDYRATYTAYDGHRIAIRMLTSPDLSTFRALPLAGPAASNKGMALFPRPVAGQHLALCRSDGETTGLAASPDGFTWTPLQTLQKPAETWELVQVGNCGSPIETDAGWLVLTHGVGPMRTYRIGAILLDLDDPSRVIGRLRRPLLEPAPDERDGYVPNVVYSCGGLLHDGVVWIPHGIGDVRIGVAWVPLDELLAALSVNGEMRCQETPVSTRS
jgi:predicted GH43/DUF377 family glycosyl hydrolase